MAKCKITVTVDEELVAFLRDGDESVSAAVNSALAAHVDRARRRAALDAMLAEWDRDLGPVDGAAAAAAARAFDDVDGIAAARADVGGSSA